MADQRGVPDLSQFTAPAESYYRLHLEALRERDFGKRVAASWGLIARGSESVPRLMLMLSSRNADSREDAVGALAWLGTKSDGIVRELLSALEQETGQPSRDSIVLALGELRNRAAIPALAQLIGSETPMATLAAARLRASARSSVNDSTGGLILRGRQSTGWTRMLGDVMPAYNWGAAHLAGAGPVRRSPSLEDRESDRL